jgi:alpha-tubulin suppressor-like RCC1 family protein
MGHVGELGRSKSMGAKLVKTELPDGSSYMAYDVGKTFIGDIVKELKTKKKDGKIIQEEEETYVHNTELIAKKFLTPAPVEFESPGRYTALDMAMGQTHMIVIARTATGETKVFATGLNTYGQLGLGDQRQRHCLTEITAFKGKDTIHQVAVGAFHSLFLNATGTAVYSCGRSDYGQLGLFATLQGAGDFVVEPRQVAFPESTKGQRFSKITAGGNSSMVSMDNGDIYTWGLNIDGQTGHAVKPRGPEQIEDIFLPTKLDIMRYYKKHDPQKGTTADILDASCGGQHSIFLVKRYAKE